MHARVPAHIVDRARQLYQEPVTLADGTQRPRTVKETHAAVLSEFPGSRFTYQAVGKWVANLVAAPPEPSGVRPAVPLSLAAVPEADPVDWAKARVRFLALLCGVADSSFAVARDMISNTPHLAFRDAEAATKVGAIALELAGKINSGKFEESADGDTLPALTPDQVKIVIAGFLNPAAHPLPTIPPKIIDVPREDAT